MVGLEVEGGVEGGQRTLQVSLQAKGHGLLEPQVDIARGLAQGLVDKVQGGGTVPAPQGLLDVPEKGLGDGHGPAAPSPTAQRAKAYSTAVSFRSSNRPAAPAWPASMFIFSRTGRPLVETGRRRATHLAGSQ